MKKALSILSIFLLCGPLSFAQLTVVNTGTNAILNQISLIGSNIVVNGRNDYMAKCYDECDTLIPLTVPGPIGYNNYYLNRMDTNNFFILSIVSSSDYRIYKSSDGGYSWELKFDTSGMFLNTLAFFDTLEGFATGTSYKSIRTQDGGNTWTNEWDISNPFIITTAMEVFGDSTICMGTNESFCISHDRGNTRTCNMFGVQASPRDFFFLNKDTILATSDGAFGTYFSHSFDGGAIWQHNSFAGLGIGFNPYGIYFKSETEGYVVGNDNDNYGIILKTTDLGQSWSVLNTQITTLLIDIEFLNDSIALIAGTGGVLLKWNSKTFSTNISEILTPYFNVTIYPNPATGLIIITGLPKETTRIMVYNILGELVHRQELNGSNDPLIDLSALPDGLYVIQLQNRQMTLRKKIIKQY